MVDVDQWESFNFTACFLVGFLEREILDETHVFWASQIPKFGLDFVNQKGLKFVFRCWVLVENDG